MAILLKLNFIEISYFFLSVKLTTTVSDCVEFEFTVRLTRACKIDQVALMVGDNKNRIIFKTLLT